MYRYLKYPLLFFVSLLVLQLPACAQKAGPVITEYGKVFQIEAPDIPTSTSSDFEAVFDVYDSPSGSQGVNPQLETAARYLNMHAQSGIAVEKLKVALVVHGKASEDLLKADIYKNKHGHDNPNADLVKKLLSAGVEIAICGQSATSRNIRRQDLINGVQWSLSAMSALVHYQNNGYQLIKF